MSTKKHLIAPSVLAADFGNLQRDVEMVNQSQADWFHIDIMDGVFWFPCDGSYRQTCKETVGRTLDDC